MSRLVSPLPVVGDTIILHYSANPRVKETTSGTVLCVIDSERLRYKTLMVVVGRSVVYVPGTDDEFLAGKPLRAMKLPFPKSFGPFLYTSGAYNGDIVFTQKDRALRGQDFDKYTRPDHFLDWHFNDKLFLTRKEMEKNFQLIGFKRDIRLAYKPNSSLVSYESFEQRYVRLFRILRGINR